MGIILFNKIISYVVIRIEYLFQAFYQYHQRAFRPKTSELFYAIQQTQTKKCLTCDNNQYNFQAYFFLVFPLEEVRKHHIIIIFLNKMNQIMMNKNNFNMNNFNMMNPNFNQMQMSNMGMGFNHQFNNQNNKMNINNFCFNNNNINNFNNNTLVQMNNFQIIIIIIKYFLRNLIQKKILAIIKIIKS